MNRRTLIVSGIAGFASGGVVFAAPIFHDWGELDATASITSVTDPLKINRVSGLQIAVSNHTTTALNPTFSIIREDLQTKIYWQRRHTKQVIQPRQTVNHWITAPTEEAAVPHASKFILGIQDIGSGHSLKLGPQTAGSLRC
jgi:hypothetical protein